MRGRRAVALTLALVAATAVLVGCSSSDPAPTPRADGLDRVPVSAGRYTAAAAGLVVDRVACAPDLRWTTAVASAEDLATLWERADGREELAAWLAAQEPTVRTAITRATALLTQPRAPRAIQADPDRLGRFDTDGDRAGRTFVVATWLQVPCQRDLLVAAGLDPVAVRFGDDADADRTKRALGALPRHLADQVEDEATSLDGRRGFWLTSGCAGADPAHLPAVCQAS